MSQTGTSGDSEVTLDNCHLEPIHIPGSIQPHGFLLVIDPLSSAIRHASKNCENVFDTTLDQLIHSDLDNWMPPAITNAIRNAEEPYHSINPLVYQSDSGKRYDLIVSRNEKYLLLSFEQAVASPGLNFETHYYQIRSFLNTIIEIDSIRGIFDLVATEVRAMTGFDRVMVYRFDEKYNGEVIAEAKRDGLNSFLRQHFPESDIPAQARALYIKNRIRILADVDARPVPILPNTEAIDLSASSLRSVSPIHCQYLRNMGVAASMSISLTLGDRLWGLIACHHYAPRLVSFHTRETAAYLGLTLSHFIAVRARERQSRTEARTQTLLTSILNDISSEVEYLEGLSKTSENVMNLVGATGMAWCLDGRLSVFGSVPEESDIFAIYNWFSEGAEVSDTVYMTDSLSRENPDFLRFSAPASGLLLVRIGLHENQFFMWFRKELIQTKNWGGKPEKTIEFLDDGSHRLMPRSSFEIWRESVRAHGEPWTELDKVSALKLRNSIVNYVLRRTEEVKQINYQLRQSVEERTAELREEVQARILAEERLKRALQETRDSNEQLEKFAYVASHDLQEPLRKIQSFGSRIETLADKHEDPALRQYLERMISAADRMQTLIRDLLSFSRLNRAENKMQVVDLDTLLQQVCSDIALLIQERSASVEVGPLAEVTGDPSQLHRLFQNLIQNAIKFSSEGRLPVVRVAVSSADGDRVVYVVEDNGIGFEMEYKDRVFELFQRLHGRKHYEGTGLGLAICKKIMERHQGTIRAESIPGQGTRMYLSFPQTQS